MYYKNTMKLFASNFTLVWKQVAYVLCLIFILSLCSYTTLNPIVVLLKENNIGSEVKTIFETVYSNPKEIILIINEFLKNIYEIIILNFSKIALNLILGSLFILILPYIIFHMSIYNLSSIFYSKLTMNMNVGYVKNYLDNFSKSLKFSLSSLLFNIPFVLLEILFFEIYITIVSSFLSALIGLSILSLIIIFIKSLKLSLFSYFTGRYITTNENVFKSFQKSFKPTFSNLWKLFSNSLMINLTIIFINSFLAVFTFFGGLIITLPASFVLISIYNMVSYLSLDGDRFYISETIIFNPKPYTIKKDDFVTISIPEVQKEVNVETTKIKKINKKENHGKYFKSK